MNATEEVTRSLWMQHYPLLEAVPLRQKLETDVVVVGAGIAGLSTAYELRNAGFRVAVLDRGQIGGGMTCRTTAHLSPVCDDGMQYQLDRIGMDAAGAFYRSHGAAIDRIEEISRQEGINCNFARVNGYLIPAEETAETMIGEFEASRKLGLEGVDIVGASPARPLCGPRSLCFAGQARFNPALYLKGLCKALLDKDVQIYADTPVMHAEENGTGVILHTELEHPVSANYAVFSTNSPVNDRVAIHSKQAPYRTYAIAVRIPKDSLEDALYWDTADPYHYVRLEPCDGQHDWVIAGGEDHKTGEDAADDRRFSELHEWLRQQLPDLGPADFKWSGQVMETLDGAAYSGVNPGNKKVFVHTGDSGQGITHAVAGAMNIRSLITDGQPLWGDLYDPSRIPLKSAGRYMAENLDAAKSLIGYLQQGELESGNAIAPGTGAVYGEATSKVAAYRKPDGELIRLSASCTHLGCLVSWNNVEKCWDCRCHGSHFSPEGKVLSGPAIHPLSEAG